MEHYLQLARYREFNAKLSHKISDRYGSNIGIRAFENSALALYDLCFGLLQFLSHRPKIGLIRQGTSLPDVVLPHLYRNQTPIFNKKESENFEQYLSHFDHEVNFVLWSSENEVTGEIFYNRDSRLNMHKAISAKRIFSIEIKSKITQDDLDILKNSPYTVYVETGNIFNKRPTLIYHTDKLKTDFLIGPYQNNLDYTEDWIQKYSFDPESKTALDVLSLFKSSQLNYYNRFATQPEVLPDRLVISSKSVSGLHLKEDLGLSSEQAFAPSELPIAVLETFPLWWREAQNKDLIVGLLIVNLNKTNSTGLIDKIEKMHDKLTQESRWSIE